MGPVLCGCLWDWGEACPFIHTREGFVQLQKRKGFGRVYQSWRHASDHGERHGDMPWAMETCLRPFIGASQKEHVTELTAPTPGSCPVPTWSRASRVEALT